MIPDPKALPEPARESSGTPASPLGSASLNESYRQSLRLQEMRIASLQTTLEERTVRVIGLENSASWRLTAPVRLVRSLAVGRLPSGLKLKHVVLRIRDIVKVEGLGGLRRRARGRIRAKRRSAVKPPDPFLQIMSVPAPPPAQLRRSVLIVAELSVPQCAKYRVWQKQELFQRLGWPCAVVDWHETDAAYSALQCCTQVIFYRVPARPSVLALIAESRRLGLKPFWEVDDLIFDEALYRRNSNLASLPPSLRREVLDGIRLYRQAMLACGRAIASTPVLASSMREAGVTEAAIVENALDRETLAVAQGLRRDRSHAAASPIIVYGSGTRTHDADFAVAAPAIAQLLAAYPALRLRIVGHLTLPDGWERFAEQIETYASTNYPAYLRLLSEGDIAIAPLEATLFNDAKSNIKFQEAAILGMPCVCSPRAAFTDIVVQEHNGLLAATLDAWRESLERLIRDAGLRDRLGRQALEDVSRRYDPDRVAADQLSPIFGAPAATATGGEAERPLRVLAANVFLWPRSFGGATIVAEELARRLHDRPDTEISVFTSRGDLTERSASLVRYDWQGIPVFAAPLPTPGDHVAGFDNPASVGLFAATLDAVRPDVVHAHSIQGFGAGILRLCQERGIPYVITLHDAWWLCDRQFMVRGDGNYCFQTRIDLRVCQACVPNARHLDARRAILHQVLQGAAHLLSPSESHRQLYLANGISPERISVSRNGIRRPGRPRAPRPAGAVPRFGFVGGNEAIKGFHLLRAAFETIDRDPIHAGRWELVLVDNTLNLGFSSINVSDWNISGKIKIVPAYPQDGLDAFFDRIDVLLFPSQWKESYGLTVREALIRDVWVIATAPGGQAEDIVDGENGRLIPLDGRAAGLIEAIEEILLGPSKLDNAVNPYRDILAHTDAQVETLHAVLQQARLNKTAALL